MTQPTELDMERIAREAFRRAADRVIEKAEQTGTPVIIGKGRQIMRLTPEEARQHLKTSSDFPDDADDDGESESHPVESGSLINLALTSKSETSSAYCSINGSSRFCY